MAFSHSSTRSPIPMLSSRHSAQSAKHLPPPCSTRPSLPKHLSPIHGTLRLSINLWSDSGSQAAIVTSQTWAPPSQHLVYLRSPSVLSGVPILPQAVDTAPIAFMVHEGMVVVTASPPALSLLDSPYRQVQSRVPDHHLVRLKLPRKRPAISSKCSNRVRQTQHPNLHPLNLHSHLPLHLVQVSLCQRPRLLHKDSNPSSTLHLPRHRRINVDEMSA